MQSSTDNHGWAVKTASQALGNLGEESKTHSTWQGHGCIYCLCADRYTKSQTSVYRTSISSSLGNFCNKNLKRNYNSVGMYLMAIEQNSEKYKKGRGCRETHLTTDWGGIKLGNTIILFASPTHWQFSHAPSWHWTRNDHIKLTMNWKPSQKYIVGLFYFS